MIIVSVILVSAVDGRAQELARTIICNDGEGTAKIGNYTVESLRGRSTDDFGSRRVMRRGRVDGFPRVSLHVWNLVARALASMGYK